MLARPEKQGVKRSFSRAASQYDEIAILQKEVGSSLLARLPSYSLRERRVLDVGAGTGFCTAKLAARGAEVIALDIAPGMLIQAKTRTLKDVHYICGDAESLPLESESIDIVVSNLALQWCIRLDDLFAGLRRVLKPGGVLFFSSFGPATLHELKLAWELVDQYTHVNEFYSTSELSQVIGCHGFVNIGFEAEMERIRYPSALSLMRELKGLGAGNVTQGRFRGMTGKAKLQRVVEHYEEVSPGEGVIASFDILYGRASKPRTWSS